MKVFFTWGNADGTTFDRGFRRRVRWDIPMLSGYSYAFVPNLSPRPGTHHFMGLVNPSLYRELGRWRPDVVLVNGYKYLSHLISMIRWSRGGLPVLFRGDSHLLSTRPLFKRLVRKMVLKRLFGRTAACLYCGTLNRAYFREFGVPDHKLFFVPHNVDNDRFSDHRSRYREAALEMRRQLGISPQTCVVLFAGKFQKKKRPQDLVRAFRLAGMPNTRLILVGDGELRDYLRKLTKDLAIRAVFLPFQNQSRMPVVYRMGDLFVLPSSDDETWGLSVNEAMCCGLPVAVSDQVGCGPDLIRTGVNGWMFPAKNVAALARQLREAAGDMKKLTRMGDVSRRIISNWNAATAGDGVLRACYAVTGRGPDLSLGDETGQ
jgi:glycosyltransferase involved in cell wall biosynthesis